MKPIQFNYNLLLELGPCRQGREWALQQKDAVSGWHNCENGLWLAWLMLSLEIDDRYRSWEAEATLQTRQLAYRLILEIWPDVLRQQKIYSFPEGGLIEQSAQVFNQLATSPGLNDEGWLPDAVISLMTPMQNAGHNMANSFYRHVELMLSRITRKGETRHQRITQPTRPSDWYDFIYILLCEHEKACHAGDFIIVGRDPVFAQAQALLVRKHIPCPFISEVST